MLLDQLEIQWSHGPIEKTLYAMVLACRESRGREKMVQGGAVNARVMGMFVVGIRVMVMRVPGNRCPMTFCRGK
jgi:hypothetical protein